MLDLERVRADEASAELRAVPGQLAYQPLLCSWSQRGRMLATELLSGPDSTRGEEPRALLARALDYLPEGHGGFYRIDLLADCRKGRVRFSISVPRTSAMWSALERIPEDAWEPTDSLTDAEVAETTYTPEDWDHEPLRMIARRVAHQADALADDPLARRRRTVPREQLALGLAGEADTVYGYSFSLTDLAGDAVGVDATIASARRSRSASKTTSSASRCGGCRCRTSTTTGSGSRAPRWR